MVGVLRVMLLRRRGVVLDWSSLLRERSAAGLIWLRLVLGLLRSWWGLNDVALGLIGLWLLVLVLLGGLVL
jgi:hypothetical protein